MANEGSISAPQSSDPPPEEAALYFKHRTRGRRAVLLLVASIVALIIFRNPNAWADGVVASWIYYGAWILLAGGSLVAYRAQGDRCEAVGFLRGRYRQTPEQLLARQVGAAKQGRR